MKNYFIKMLFISVLQHEFVFPDCPPIPEAKASSFHGRTKMCRRKTINSPLSPFIKEEGRAMKTGVIVIVSFVVSWVPFYLYRIIEIATCHHPYIEDLATLFALSASCTMPFIYVYRNEVVKQEACKLLRCCTTINNTPTHLMYNSSLRAIENQSEQKQNDMNRQKSYLVYPNGFGQCDSPTMKNYFNRQNGHSPLRSEREIKAMPRRQSTVSFRLDPITPKGCRHCFKDLSSDFTFPEDPSFIAKLDTRINTRSNSVSSTISSSLTNCTCSSKYYHGRRMSTASTSECGMKIPMKSSDNPLYSLDASPKISLKKNKFSGEMNGVGRFNENNKIHGYSNPLDMEDSLYIPEGQMNKDQLFVPMSYGSTGTRNLSVPNIDISYDTNNGYIDSNSIGNFQIDHTGHRSPKVFRNSGNNSVFNSRKISLLRANSNPKFLQIPRIVYKGRSFVDLLDRDNYSVRNISRSNEAKFMLIRESRSAE